MHVLALDFVPNNPEHQGRQAGVDLRVELQIQQSPCLASIVEWDAFDDLESSSSCMTNKAAIQIRRLLILLRILI